MKWLSGAKTWFLAQSAAIKTLLCVVCLAVVAGIGTAVYFGVRSGADADEDMYMVSVDDPVISQEDTKPTPTPEQPSEEKDQDEETDAPEGDEAQEEAEEEEPFVNTTGKLINGNFKEGLKGFEVYAYYPDDISYTVDPKTGLSVNIAHTGEEDWHVQLKQGGIKLQNGSWYQLTLDAKSDLARDIICTMQRNGIEDDVWTAYSPSQHLSLTKSWKTFNIYFQMTEKTDSDSVFNLSMGAVDGKVIAKQHTVSVRNISLKKLDDTWLSALRQGENLIGNNNFAYQDILWETTIVSPGEAKATFEEGKAVFDIKNPGQLDWNVQLKQSGIRLEQGKGYRLTFQASSTVARTIKIGFMDKDFVNWYGGADVTLSGGAEQTVMVEFYMDKATNPDAVMMVSMGKMENQDTPASVITLSQFKLVNAAVSPASSGGYGVAFNPITNLTDGWFVYDHEDTHVSSCTVDGENGFKIDINDTGTEDWHVQLQKKNVALEKGKWYQISFEAKSSLDRALLYMLQRDGAADEVWTTYSNAEQGKITLNGEWQTFTQTFHMLSDSDNAAIFNISMGSINGTRIAQQHSVWVRNIRLVETVEPQKEPVKVGEEMVAGFKDSGSSWQANAGAAANSYSYEGDRIVFDIQDPGVNDYDVQLTYPGLTLEKGCTYQISLQAEATQARTIKIGILGPDLNYLWYGGEDIVLNGPVVSAGTRTSGNGLFLVSETGNNYTIEFTMSQETDYNATLAISMGKIETEDTPPCKITLGEISMKKTAEASETGEPSTAPPVTTLTDGWVLNDNEGTHTVKSSVDGENGYKIEIRDTGTQEWHIQLQKTGLKMEQGKQYTVTLEAKSTLPRSIVYLVQENGGDYTSYSGDGTINLTDEWQTFTQTFEMTAATDQNAVFNISMGSINGTRITQQHSVWVRNIQLVETVEPEKPEKEPVKIGEEMVAGFKDSGSSWQVNKGADSNSYSYEGDRIVFDIQDPGVNDYDVQLTYPGLTLEKGCTYQISLQAEATQARTIKIGILGPDLGYVWYGGEDIKLNGPVVSAGTRTSGNGLFLVSETGNNYTIEFTMSQETDYNATLAISMGKIKTEDTPPCKITLGEISMKKTAEVSETGEPSTALTDGWVLNDNKGTHTVKSSVDGENGYKIEIRDTGTEEWHVQLQKTGLKMEQGKQYTVTLEAKSTLPRSIVYLMQENGGDYTSYSGDGTINLTDEWQTFTQTFVMTAETDQNAVFNISMGSINGTRITQQHSVWVRNIQLVETVESEKPEKEPVKVGEEMVAGFKDSGSSWQANAGAAANSYSYEGDRIVFDIQDPGVNDYDVQLTYPGLTLEKGCTYQISLQAEATQARTIKIDVLGPDLNYVRYGGEDIKLNGPVVSAGTRASENGLFLVSETGNKYTIEFTMSQETDYNATLAISMGKIETEDTPSCKITLGEISMKKTAEVSETGEPSTALTDGWVLNDNEGTHTVKSSVDGENGYKIEIRDTGTEEWHIQLQKTGLKMEQGKQYTVTLEAKSTLPRSIVYLVQENGGDYTSYSGDGTINLTNEWQTFTQTFEMTAETDQNAVFNISMGTSETARIKEPHTIWIRNLNVEEAAGQEEGPAEPDENLLKNGTFADGSSWSIGSEVSEGASIQYTGNQAVVTVTDPGNEIWDVQLKQDGLTLEQGCTYVLTFEASSTVDRTIKVAFQLPDNTWYGGTDVVLTDTMESKRLEFTVEKDTSSEIIMQIQMGKTGDDLTLPHTITLTNFSLKKVQ